MYNVSEQLASGSKAGVETFVTMANATFAGFERLATLNLNTARSLLEDSQVYARALLAAKDLQALAALQGTLAQPGPNATATYSRSVYEIASQTQATLSKAVEVRVAELNEKLGMAFEKAAQTAPAGSDLALNAMRTALSAANSAYDNMGKAARQAADLAEANLAVAASLAARNRKQAA
ncbi:TIGR01841 family phasin [Sulfuritalea sp.]|uniref:TIGR01841 family phasin n=1 Tax=Sulfuritalea sp. TaxID=2480090 RepID=UPI00286E0EFE|nr:TIGR01841 family phasin [Sulfuritalea sp.]